MGEGKGRKDGDCQPLPGWGRGWGARSTSSEAGTSPGVPCPGCGDKGRGEEDMVGLRDIRRAAEIWVKWDEE